MKDTTFMKVNVVICLVALGGAVLISTQTRQPVDSVPRSAWMTGALPVGVPVIGVWIHQGEVVTMACIATDYAGLFEFTLVGRDVPPIDTRPDYWAPMPERFP